jgi:S-formylglutathione hydrolase
MPGKTTLHTRSEHACFGGRMGFYAHHSVQTSTDMNFAVYVPPQAEQSPVPALYYLAGLTCTEETFMIKAGAQRLAAQYGLMLVTCDTSPRGLNLPGEADAWDFGAGAGFYIDATREPWAKYYRMGSYVNLELPSVIEEHFPAQKYKRGIFGHSMGGHGALVTALRHRDRWYSVSAFAPISNPCAVPWGEKAFGKYLGPDRSLWQDWDASVLMSSRAYPGAILVDQGGADQFVSVQLKPEALEAAAKRSGQKLILRRQADYDHSYYFISTFIEDHIKLHHRNLSDDAVRQ